MAFVSAIDDLLEANRRFAASFAPGSAPPSPRLALVLCMDARIDPIRALGLAYGHAHIIRNAGGRVADALRSLAMSQGVLGTREVAVVHHTECGMMAPGDDAVREKVHAGGVQRLPETMPLLTFTDLETSVRDDLALYRSSPLVRQDVVLRGFVYDVSTGALTEVE
jgi:carbonic anhydrase